jgi:hypothetical protein
LACLGDSYRGASNPRTRRRAAAPRGRNRSSAGGLESIAVDDIGPAEELMALEDDADLEALVRVASVSLSERRRDVFVLYAAGCSRAQIGERSGCPSARSSATSARSWTGEGCGGPTCRRWLSARRAAGRPLGSAVSRRPRSRPMRASICPAAAAARRSAKADRLAGEGRRMLPAPVAEGASPGVIERATHRSAERFGENLRHIRKGSVCRRKGLGIAARFTAPRSGCLSEVPACGSSLDEALSRRYNAQECKGKFF